MRIAGIDCGTERTGFGVIDSDGRSHTLVTAGVIRTKPQHSLEYRLKLIAGELREPIHRVLHVLSTRQHIRPSARAGTLRLYDRQAVAMVRHELNAIDARRCRKAVRHAE